MIEVEWTTPARCDRSFCLSLRDQSNLGLNLPRFLRQYPDLGADGDLRSNQSLPQSFEGIPTQNPAILPEG